MGWMENDWMSEGENWDNRNTRLSGVMNKVEK